MAMTDQIVPIGLSARVVESMLPSAQVKIYGGAPHSMTFTPRDRLNADLLSFLRR
jgi:non-heme chloroperoxidase